MGWKSLFVREIKLSDIGHMLKKRSWQAIDARAHLDDFRNNYSGESKSVLSKIRSHLLLGTSDVQSVTNIDAKKLNLLNKVLATSDKLEEEAEGLTRKLRKTQREQKVLLDAVVERNIREIRDSEAEARMLAQAAGLERMSKEVKFLGFIPLGIIGATITTGAVTAQAVIKSIDPMFGSMKTGVGVAMDKHVATHTLDERYTAALDADRIRLQEEWEKVIKPAFKANKTLVLANNERVKNWFKAMMDFALKMGSVFITAKRITFNGQEAAKWNQLESEALGDIIRITELHLDTNLIINGLKVPHGGNYNPRRVARRLQKVLINKEELAE